MNILFLIFILIFINILGVCIINYNKLYYILYILVSCLITFLYLLYNNIHTYFYIGVVISIISIICVNISCYFLYQNIYYIPPKGFPGYTGFKGTSGTPNTLSETCYEFLVNITNNDIIAYSNSTNNNNNKILFNNKFMKQKYKQICNSKKFIEKSKLYNDNTVLIELKNSIKKWNTIILNYKNGFIFINNNDYTDKSWDELLSNLEISSPFNKIKSDLIWDWI